MLIFTWRPKLKYRLNANLLRRWVAAQEVQAEPARPTCVWPRAHHASQGDGHQLHVVPVGRHHLHCQRYALPFSEQAALDATFAAVGGVGADFFPRPAGLWSSCHPVPANPSRSLSNHRIPASRAARNWQIPRHRPIPGSVEYAAAAHEQIAVVSRACHCIVRSTNRIASMAASREDFRFVPQSPNDAGPVD